MLTGRACFYLYPLPAALQVEQLRGSIKHHIPLAVLFKDYWAGVLLQFLLEGCYGAAFYTFFTWVPAYMSKSLHVPSSNTLWALLVGLVLFALACPLAGHFVGDTKVCVLEQADCIWRCSSKQYSRNKHIRTVSTNPPSVG